MKNLLPIALIGTFAMVLAGMWWLWQPQARWGEVAAQAPRGGDFTLESWRGTERLRAFRGKVVLIYFGYTWCPDVCPTNLGYIALALEQLSQAERQRVQVLFISVDPQRDTLQRLREYTDFFHARMLGLTGTPEQLAEVTSAYGAAYKKHEKQDDSAEYAVDHSSYTYLVGPGGGLLRTLEHATPPDRIAAAVREALKGGRAP